jgi:hypothetical protein
LHNGYDVLAVDLAYRAAPQDLAVIAEPIDEHAVLLPAGLTAASKRKDPKSDRILA